MYSFSALYILIVIPAICEGDNEKTCNVINKNRYVELGSDVKIMCQSLCILPDKTYWTLNNDLIDDRLSETINSSYTVLSLRNFTTQSATVQCHGFVTGHVIGGTTIRTYAKPSKISCILQNPIWYSPTDFSCNWEHKMSSSLEITYTVHRKCAFYSENCTSKTTSCTFKMAPLLGKNFSITVRASTTAWEVVSDTYEFDPYHIWKITAPEIQVTALSDQLLVELNQRQLEHHQVHCQVEYNKSLSGGTQEQLLNIVINPLDGRKNVTIEEVESCTDYTVSARCALDKAPWSDWSQKKTVLSKLKKSTVKLGLWRTLADPGKNGVRKVYVMWTEIPSSCKGEFYYTIDVTPYKKYTPLVDENYHTDAFCNASACDVNVGPDAHSITLTVLHNGNPLGNESIYVPAFGESLPQVKHIQTSTHEGDIVLRWQAPVENVSGYMVDWTHDGKKHYWKENKYTNTTLYDLEDFKQYNVTVTPLFDDKTGLGTQAIQICSRERVPETISISEVLAKDRSALVTWNKESQFQCSGGVVNYAVFYRTEKGSQLNVTVDSTEREALLEDLKPATKYSVHVMAIALTGNSSSIDRYFETKRYDPRLILVLSICGGVVILLVISLGLCCGFQWKKFTEMVPNPGFSSLALWSPQSHQKISQPFNNPSESQTVFEKVYPCELDITTSCITPLVTGFHDNSNLKPAGGQTMGLSSGVICRISSESEDSESVEETDIAVSPANVPAPGLEEERPANPVETPPHKELSVLPVSENSPLSPYRSQGSDEPPALSTSECESLPAKKTPPVTVYITLDMFQQGQGR